MKQITSTKLLFLSIIILFVQTNLFAQPCNITPPLLSVDISGTPSTLSCNGNPLIMSTTSPSDCPSCTYLWSTGDTSYTIFVPTSGSYSVTVTDNSNATPCIGVSSAVSVTIGSLVVPVLAANPYTICIDADSNVQPAVLQVTNPCIGCSYLWYEINDPIIPVVGPTTSSVNSNITQEGDYYVRVIDALGCIENSNIVRVDSGFVSPPMLVSNTVNLCDSNVATLNTIDCNGCNYRWQYYDFLPEGKLIISGIYDGTRRGAPKGIELYAIGNIPDLSAYSIAVSNNNSIPVLANHIVLPSIALASGSYYYITEKQADFLGFFGFSPNLISTEMDIDGNDPVAIYFGGNIVDIYGEENYNTAAAFCSGAPLVCDSLPWGYKSGWARRKDNSVPEPVFDTADWVIQDTFFVVPPRNDFWKQDSFPASTFVNSATIPPNDSFIITGLYAGTAQAGGGSIGVEFKALQDIPDLSIYNIQVVLDGSSAFCNAFQFPAISVVAGQYVYLSSDAAEFQQFLLRTADDQTAPTVLPISFPTTFDCLDQVNGNDCIVLRRNIVVVDQLGDDSYNALIGPVLNGVSWAHMEGWIYRVNGTSGNQGNFLPADWIINSEAFLPTNNIFGAAAMPVRQFVSDAVGAVQQIIPQADTSFYQTSVTGFYAVEIEYPNSCVSTSELILLDTSIFAPQIAASSSSSTVSTIRDTVYGDTVYLCTGSYVDLFAVGDYRLPPNWVYQWHQNALPLVGSNGFSHRTYVPGQYYLEVTNADGCLVASDIITVVSSSNGSNPPISASDLYLCSDAYIAVLATSSCTGCSYEWRTEDGFAAPTTNSTSNPAANNTPNDQAIYSATQRLDVSGNAVTRGYNVVVTDGQSGCSYSSPIVEVRDTTYPPPVMAASGNTICSTDPITLSTTACANCQYEWQRDVGSGFNWSTTTSQATFQTGFSGRYRVRILHANGCETGVSNTIQISFTNTNANIRTPLIGDICNNQSIVITALPRLGATTCNNCTYTFLRDSVAMQSSATLPVDQQLLTIAGNYQVVVTNSQGCADTSIALPVEEININTTVTKSANKICSPTSEVVMEVDSCDGCTYQWFLNATPLITSRDTFYQAYGYAAADTYSIAITKADCDIRDTIVLDTVAQRFVDIEVDSTVSNNPIICDGSRVVLVDQCDTCILDNDYTYQWFSLTDTLVGANFESFQVDTPGTYYVQTIDTNLCVVLSDTMTVDEFLPDPALALDFATLGTNGVVPITYGSFLINDFLQPASLRSTGGYTSLTAQGAINPITDSLNVGIAGSGYHFITYTYTVSNAQGSCDFSTMDTLEVLGAVGITIANTKAGVPPSEACIGDVLEITLTNFTFEPDTVTFVTGGGNTISVGVTTALSQFAGVFSGSFTVPVPIGARTGKITLSDLNNSFESPNFFVIQNPAVTIDLVSTIQPICSNLDTATLRGIPSGGTLTAAYLGMPVDTSLMADTFLLLDSVMGYTSGVQQVTVYYNFVPNYTASDSTCPAILDSLDVEIRDARLDSVEYTPISVTQLSEPLTNLTKFTYPLSAADYPNSYTGTYVLANNLLASNLLNNLSAPPTQITEDSITYQINNGGCVSSSVDPIDLWPAPSMLDSVPVFLCSQDDTVFIQRDLTGVTLRYRNQTIFESLYAYQENINVSVGNPLEVRYSEFINLMEITTSNGGVDSINFFAPNELYYFVPANVTSSSTRITLKFKYNRVANYFSNGSLTRTDTTSYTIAEVSKVFQIEDPSVVSINPTILVDTVFCPDSINTQLLGTPAGGAYYLSGGSVPYQRLANNIYNPMQYPINSSYQLTYVYEGRACVDSAATGIYVPDTFSIAVRPDNLTGDYCLTSPNDTVRFSIPYGTNTTIDPNSAQFFIRGIQAGTIFSPSQVGPAGLYNVRYAVSDVYGCSEEATDIFEVFPIPVLSRSAIDSVFCLNDDTVQIQLYEASDTTIPAINVTTWPTGLGVPATDTVIFDGAGIVDGGQMTTATPGRPYFFPRTAGVGVHSIRYVYKDENSCMDSINFDIEVLPLPQVSMTTNNLRPLEPYYCENDSIPLFGAPVGTSFNSGYGSYLDSVLHPTVTRSSLDSADTAFEPFVAGFTPGIVREWLYYYYEDRNGCRDTAFYDVRIRNFTTDPIISGFDNAAGRLCASDTNVIVVADPNGGFDLDSLGWFTSSFGQAFSQLTDTAFTDSIAFYPDSTGIQFADRDVIVTFNYTDTARVCYNSISDTIRILALPYLTLSEQLVSSLPAMDPIGSKLIAPRSDTFYHICETEPDVPIYAYNTTGFYDPFTGGLSLFIPDHISSDTGVYTKGDGIVSNSGGGSIAYAYKSSLVGFGLDTIRYVYKDNRGCIDSVDYYVVVDSLPVLSFAGLSNYDSTIMRYVYCEAEPNPPSILPAPTGVSWTMNFAGQNITSVPFDLLPDTLAVLGTYVDYPLRYDYVGQIYRSGATCSSFLEDTIQIRPSPPLAWVNAPSDFCMSDSSQRIPLSATPYGGTFVDATNNFQVIAGIVGDSLFNPSAQAGKRDIYYYYLDTASGCDDTIQHTIYVYSKPQINFDLTGGCSGQQVELTPRTAPYGLQYNGVAIDSITQVIWNFGDGSIDTFDVLPNTLFVPVDTHTYFNYGVFYPSLTVVNQGVCDSTFVRRIVISPKIVPYDTLPYVEPFDLAINGWFQESSDTLSVNGIVRDSLWEWGLIDGDTMSTLLSGNTAWATRLSQKYGQGEDAWVYSPCFDLTNLDRPMIKLDIWRVTENKFDGAVLQYFDDSTQTWKVLGEHGRGIGWYQNEFVVSGPGNQTGVPTGWTGTNSTWEDARYRLDNVGSDLRDRDNIRFRIAFASASGTLVGRNDGFAFDNVMIGNRTRNVLVEHFSAVGYPGISQIETELYRTIYNNLYGRDVNLIQYHSDKYINNEPLYFLNDMDNRQRRFMYDVTDADEVRVDGKFAANRTSDLLNYPELEILDIEALKDPKFKIEFLTFPNIQFNGLNSGLQATIRVTALEDMPNKLYHIMATVTKDSLVTLTGHATRSVLLANYPNNGGTDFTRAWVQGDFVDVQVDLPSVNPTLHPNTSLLQLIAFVETRGSLEESEVFQVETTRNLNIFSGSVDSVDVSVTKLPGVEATQFNLYPNPAAQQFQVDFDVPLEDDYEWYLVNSLGQSMRQGKAATGTNTIPVDTDDLTAGFYVFIIRNKNVYAQRKVIIKKP
ncbi:MAG: T9SS type A sorting domain-containing protein [Aureispira sp.]